MPRGVCAKYGRAVCAKVVAKVFKVVILISHQIIYLFIVLIQLKVLCVS